MARTNKASIKRSKPSYFMSILGVTLVLVLLGIIGWLVINANKLGDYFKESIEVKAFLRGDLNPKDSAALVSYVNSRPYTRSTQFVDKEQAKKIYLADGNESWDKFMTENPLPNAIYVAIKTDYVEKDSLEVIKKDLEQQTYVSDVNYPESLIDVMTKNIRNISIVILAVAILLSLVAIVLIDNTIRLAMFSNRFLIKTMQMVGATRGFIARPMNIRAIINGAIGGVIASAFVYLMILGAERVITGLYSLRDNTQLALLFTGLILIGVLISLLSTYRSVLKYLRMKLDDLY
ncbi:hypothetical protein JMG10_08570 [Nostoc ellipsosporum NOK]|jgi:cell division transport system permease protein|nr:hypothetical protein [Nostoc ellipsosporum NOK]